MIVYAPIFSAQFQGGYPSNVDRSWLLHQGKTQLPCHLAESCNSLITTMTPVRARGWYWLINFHISSTLPPHPPFSKIILNVINYATLSFCCVLVDPLLSLLPLQCFPQINFHVPFPTSHSALLQALMVFHFVMYNCAWKPAFFLS